MMGTFEGSTQRKNKNKKYYEEHLKAMEMEKMQD